MKKGTKVRIKNNSVEHPNTIYTVDEYNEDTCGEGCCEGVRLIEYPRDVWFWPSNLEKVEENNMNRLVQKEQPLMFAVSTENHKEIIRIEQNGDFYFKGKLIENDKEVVEAFREFLIDQGYMKETQMKTLEASNNNQENYSLANELENKDLYLKNQLGEIIGIHAVGYPGPYNFTLEHPDGTITQEQLDFQIIDIWGNKYDESFKMRGGSFRVHEYNWEKMKKEILEEGIWMEIGRPK